MSRAALFGVSLLLAGACETPEREAPAETSAAAERIRQFWATYERATDARLGGRYAEAAEAYRAALELDPRHQDARFYLSVALEAEGRYPEAVAALRELVEIFPEHGKGWSQLGALLATRAPGAPFDLAGAEEALLRSEAINSEHSGPFVERGKVALEARDLEKAAELFAVAAQMGSPEAHFYSGLVELLTGRASSAMTSFAAVFDRRAKERAISGQGASSEGDVDASRMTPLDRAYLRARMFAYWASRDIGRYPENVAAEDRLELPALPGRVRVREVDGEAELADLDGDGRLELVWCSPSGLRTTSRSDALDPRRFDDVVAFDADGDGRLDLYGVGGQGNALLRNAGGGRFEDVTAARELGGTRPTSRAVAADFDGDGATDLLEVGSGPSPVRLYSRRGARYVEEAAARGLAYDGHLVDAAAADVDGDGALDVLVAGWRRPARLFLSREGRFEDATREAGLEGVGGEGLRALFFDLDRDGDPDLLVTAHAELERSLLRLARPETRSEGVTPRLFRNEGRGRYTEVTSEAGLDRAFGVVDAAAADVDGDGFVDLLFAHGGFEAQHLEPSLVLRNVEGRELADWAYLPGPDAPRRAEGVTTGDLDGDGRLDIVLSVAGSLPP